ncbi:hypothetical protein LVD15_17315 [Fulvivirga maritima]|uniref:hypothetical protein n=1 Tax=Fulvivirga maritima TaxID=2904247 RepID=UPI001F2BADB2|nr:hypothetical protein [Fulvivirga maritima]UII25060.1 hypothetical protein LVD15_17315 [Fulvivirga maritima]
MKKLILLSVLTIASVGFALSNDLEKSDSPTTNTVKYEYEMVNEGYCRYRICTTSNGTRTCGEWVYAYCLDEVEIR